MTDFHDSQPFSHKWTGIRGTSGGLTLFKAFSEWYHNDCDSQKDSGYSYTKSYFDVDTKTAYILHWSGSSGISQIEHLFSLGSTIVKKSSDNIGDKNHGHAAAVAFFNPTSMYSESLADGKYQSLTFKVKDFDDRVEKMNTGEETDYRAISVKDYMSIKREKNALYHEITTKIKDSIVDSEMKSDLESIMASNKSSYMLHLMTFDQNHLYSKSLIDDEYNNLFKSISVYYCDILKDNYTIKFEASSKPIKGPITRVADSTTAISPILDPEVYHPIHIACSMYEYTNKKTEEIDTFMKGEMRVEGHSCRFYVENGGTEKRKVYPIRFESKKEWSNAIEKGSFALSLNCPSKQLFTAYSNHLGSVDEARGVLMKMFGCILGKPSWDKESMGSQRNAGYFNIMVDMLSKNTANTYFGLKSNKHNSDLLDSHPVIRYFIGKIVKGIIDNYASYKVSTSTSGVKVWDSCHIFKQLLNKPISKNTTHLNDKSDVLNIIDPTINDSPVNEALSSEETASLEEGPSYSSAGSDVDEVEPIIVELVIVEPVVVEPVIVEPVVVEPIIVEPVVVEPIIVEPIIVEPVIVEAVVVEPIALNKDTSPNHRIGNVKIMPELLFDASIDGTLSMIDNSNVICKILSFGKGKDLLEYFNNIKIAKSPDFVRGLVKVMSYYMETN